MSALADELAALRELLEGELHERRRATSVQREPPAVRDPAADYDALGRKQPQRLGVMAFARGVPGFIGRFDRRVPAQFVAQSTAEHVEIACPCGATPRIARLSLAACACGRVFADCGREIRVAVAPATTVH